MADEAPLVLIPEALDLRGKFLVRVTAVRGDKVVDVDRLNLDSARERDRYLGRLAENFNIPLEKLEDQMRQILKEVMAEPDRQAEKARAKQAQPGAGRPIQLFAPEPWPNPVTLRDVLDEVVAAVRKFVIISDEQARAVGLWVLWTHCWKAGDICPILHITSPERRCGKTRLLEVIHLLVPDALPASNVTPSALFRAIEICDPVLLLDEGDTFLHRSEDLRGLINAGHTRATAYVLRFARVGDNYEVRLFDTFCPKVIASIGLPSSTITDRSIVIRLQRKLRTDKVARLTGAAQEELKAIARRLARAADSDDVRNAVAEGDPKIPEGLNDRAADNWRPLLALADLAGGDWPEDARRAAMCISGNDSESESTALQLIRDCLLVMDEEEELRSTELVDKLLELPDAPWRDWPITPHKVARLLRPFGIKPRHTRGGNIYRKADLLEVAKRYLPEGWASDLHSFTDDANSQAGADLGGDTSDIAARSSGSEIHAISPYAESSYDHREGYETLTEGSERYPTDASPAGEGLSDKEALPCVAKALPESGVAGELPKSDGTACSSGPCLAAGSSAKTGLDSATDPSTREVGRLEHTSVAGLWTDAAGSGKGDGRVSGMTIASEVSGDGRG